MLAGVHRFEAVAHHSLRKILTPNSHLGAIAVLEVRGRHCVRRACVTCLAWLRRLRAATSRCARRLPSDPCVTVDRIESRDPARRARVALTALRSWSSDVFVGREGVTVSGPGGLHVCVKRGREEWKKLRLESAQASPWELMMDSNLLICLRLAIFGCRSWPNQGTSVSLDSVG